MTPEDAAATLAEIANLLRHKGDSHRARAFSRVATSVLRDRPDIDALRARGQLESIDGVGATIARILAELVDTGTSTYLDKLREELKLPSLSDMQFELSPLVEMGYRGDLHAHTDWSDGHASITQMATASTPHSP